jgi:curved DNA-binding protein CbpA
LKHPDKNPDDPLAATEFILITKAYNVRISYLNDFYRP